MNDISYADKQAQQLQSVAKHLPRAQEPANPHYGTDNIVSTKSSNEYPFSLDFRVEVYLGAVHNNVNEVIESYKTVEVPATFESNGYSVNMYRPLSRTKNGVAVAPLTKLYEFLADIGKQQYLLIADDSDAIHQRVVNTVNSIQKQLLEFHGNPAQPFEDANVSEYSIARSDLFHTTVGIDTPVLRKAGLQTVNAISVVVSVYIHAASLTSASDVPEEAMQLLNSQYRTVLRNMATASSIPTELSVVFDMANFSVRPATRQLFNTLLEAGADAQVLHNAEYIPPIPHAVVVGVPLTK